jgi:hypothetical protein
MYIMPIMINLSDLDAELQHLSDSWVIFTRWAYCYVNGAMNYWDLYLPVVNMHNEILEEKHKLVHTINRSHA